MRLPDDSYQAALDALAHRPRIACGPHRYFAVVPLSLGQRYYGEVTVTLP